MERTSYTMQNSHDMTSPPLKTATETMGVTIKDHVSDAQR
jgi:hypothetical protein